MDFEQPKRLKLVRFPKGDFETWTREEKSLMEAHARAFASEYVKDFDAWQTCLRLGYEEADLKDRKIHQKYMNHWLVASYIEQLKAKFEKTGLATRERLLGLVYRDASDFSPRADARARSAAQKTMMELLGEGSTNVNHKVEGVGGGVMYLQGMSEAEWRDKAADSQRKLKEDVKKE